jgi:predicted dehydrogenase
MRSMTRRDLLKTSAATAAAFGLGAVPGFSNQNPPSDELRVAVIGTGSRGGDHIQGFREAKGARIVALCDADEAAVNRRADQLEQGTDGKVERFIDYRKLLELDEIDVVTIASPNHWHALMTIHACQAGKHVYVEKPVCHTVWEGRKMVEAMQKYRRIIGAGFQNRSDVGLVEAMPMIHDGTFGKIKEARGHCYRKRASIGKRDTPLEPPASVDYDLWLGPAADVPMMRPNFHYDWHWVFNTGNGDMGNQGPHEMDLLRWALGDPQHPGRIVSFGGRFGWDDAGDTPNMQCALFDFGNNIPVIFEVRNLYQKENPKVGAFERGPEVGIIITCENGEFRGGRGGGAFYDKQGKEVKSFKGDSGRTHMQNFVDAVRNNTPESLRSPLENAFYSSSMSHLANISVLSGQATSESELAGELDTRPLAAECFERFSAQLQSWKVDTRKTPWYLGPELTFDSRTERFTAGENAAKANSLLRRQDRKPHVVPENV